jgi:hypothetical protein
MKNPTRNKLQLQTLVLPCVPTNLTDIVDLNQLKILDIGYVNVKDRIELTRLDDILIGYRNHSLRNLTISLSEWQSTRLSIIRKKENNRQTTQFSSVFENCFDEIITSEDEDVNQSPDLEAVSFIFLNNFYFIFF